jgi:hypothetical protein
MYEDLKKVMFNYSEVQYTSKLTIKVYMWETVKKRLRALTNVLLCTFKILGVMV